MRTAIHTHRRRLAVTVGLVLVLLLPSRAALAQLEAGRGVPAAPFYSALSTFYFGDFKRGLDAFRATGKLGYRVGNNRWADSICYHTMMGECLYRLGELEQALDQYNRAARTYLMNRDWMRRVEFPATVQPTASRIRRSITWGTRPTAMGDFSRNLQVIFGDQNVQEALQQGGVFAPPELRSVDVAELVRCTALALRRRAELLGPLCASDPLSAQLLVALESRVGRANHWSQAWVEVQRGMALIGMGKIGEGADALQRSVLIAGQFDHPLTATALFELARIAERQENYGLASQNYLQASLAAAEFEQPALVEEALHRASVVHIVSGGQQVYGPLQPAGAWAKRNRFNHLYASLLVDAADNMTSLQDSNGAAEATAAARQTIGRRGRASIQLAARLALQTALVHYQNGRMDGAKQSLEEAVALQQQCSPWLYQISVLDGLYESNSEEVSPREYTLFYEQLLREPAAGDWTTSLMDTLAVAATPKQIGFQNWFDITLDRGDTARAVEVAERLRRQRFLSALPLGGRVLALRWMLEAPLELLPEDVRARRQDLRTRYPQIDELSNEVKRLRTELRKMDLAADEAEQRKQQTAVAKQLHSAVGQYERAIGQLALRREDSPMAFPPLLTMQQIQQRLASDELVLSFLDTSRATYAFMISSENEAIWKIPPNARQTMAAMLRQIGMIGDANAISAKQLNDPTWQDIGKSLVDQLIDRPQLGFWKKFEELILVPDGLLWYLPFEAMVVTTEEGLDVPLISAMRIRYAPTIGLGLPDGRRLGRSPRTAVVAGQLFPRDDPEMAQEQIEHMRTVIDDLSPLPEKLPAPSGLLRSVWDRLVVFDDVNNLRLGVFQWAPASTDQGRPGTSVDRWMRLPWGGPLEVYLPGFHTAAETGLRKSATGDEVFFALTGLMASGARTVLLSRWRTGGQTSYDLVREYLQEAPNTTASEAWQGAVHVVREIEIDPNWEPRVNVPAGDTAVLTASHPFFWSGYILCDRGDAKRQVAVPKTAVPTAEPTRPQDAPSIP